MFKLLPFISLHDQTLNTLFILFFFCINKFLVSFQLTFELIYFFNSCLVAFLSFIYILFCSLVELSDLLIDKLHLLDFSLHIHILIFLAFDCQLNVVNHLFEFVDGKYDFLILLYYFPTFIFIS